MNLDSVLDRFNKYTNKTEHCWEWLASKRNGYGQMYFNGKTDYAHRISYILFNGELSNDDVVRHTCDNPGCVNPTHLIIGTYKDNTDDMISRGRNKFINAHPGENNGRAKLTAADVEWIRNNYTGKYGEKAELARKYGVNKVTIGRIISGELWNTER